MVNKNLASNVLDKLKQFARADGEQKKAAIKSLASTALNKAKEIIRPDEEPKEDPRLTKLLSQSLVWGTQEHTEAFETTPRTVDWGHHWVIRHLSRESLIDKILVDLGSGALNPVIAYYRDKVRHAYLIDLLNTAQTTHRTTPLCSDLEKPLPLPDASVDLVVSTSVLEHLSPKGRLLQAREIERVLRPGGKAFITVSYLFDLDDHAIEVLSREPWLIEHGNTISSRLDLAAMLEQAAALRLLGECERFMFPGFVGFDEQRVLEIPGLLTHSIADSDWATFTPETNALGIKWAEVGVALEKPPVGDSKTTSILLANRTAVASPEISDVRLQRLLAACPSVNGKKILIMYDNVESFSSALEKAGAVVHSCVPDMETYTAVKERFPDRKCWVHDLERPWNLNIGDRYDIVVAFDVLQRLQDPKPFMTYVTQLAPRLVIDTIVVDSDDVEVACISSDEASPLGDLPLRCAPSPAWIKEELERLDVDIHDLSCAIPDTPSEQYAWDAKGYKAFSRNGRALRRFYLCERRRDALSPILVHVHIPKTGGQSVNQYFTNTFHDRMVHFYADKPMLARWDVFHRRMNERPSPLVFSAHVMRMHFPPILGGRVALYIAFFRHPYDVIFSYVKYIKKNYELQVPSLRKILPKNIKAMPVEDIMRWYLRNPQPIHFAGHILPVHFLTQTRDLYRAKEIVRRFFFVGITEEMSRSIEVLKQKLVPYGFYFQSVQWQKKNTTAGLELDGYDIRADKEFLDYANEKLAHELEFYEWAKARLDREAQRFGL